MEDKQLNLNITPEVAEGKYSNLAIISHSPTEFIIDFAQLVPGVDQANVRQRVIMTPENAKKVLMALQDNIAKYENNFGKITPKGNPIPGSTIPMSFGGGEA